MRLHRPTPAPPRGAGGRPYPPPVLVFGNVALDVVARHTGPIVPGGDVRAKVSMTPGGAGANTAAWLARLGAETTLVSRIGDDLAGDRLHRDLSAAGVNCAFAVDAHGPTGCVVVLVDERGERTMLPDPGPRLSATDLDPALLDGVAHLHLSGYVLLLDESSRQAGIAVLAAARRAGLSTSVDPQSASMLTDPAGFLNMIRGVDLLLPNTEELAALTGSRDPASARALLDVVDAVAVTAGKDGASWVCDRGITHLAAEPTKCVDSTGAGDAFDAGVLVSWLGGASTEEILRAGVRLAARAIGQVGGRSVSRR